MFKRKSFLEEIKSILDAVKLSGISEISHFFHLRIPPLQKISQISFKPVHI
jgi:hypothetical protein